MSAVETGNVYNEQVDELGHGVKVARWHVGDAVHEEAAKKEGKYKPMRKIHEGGSQNVQNSELRGLLQRALRQGGDLVEHKIPTCSFMMSVMFQLKWPKKLKTDESKQFRGRGGNLTRDLEQLTVIASDDCASDIRADSVDASRQTI